MTTTPMGKASFPDRKPRPPPHATTLFTPPSLRNSRQTTSLHDSHRGLLVSAPFVRHGSLDDARTLTFRHALTLADAGT